MFGFRTPSKGRQATTDPETLMSEAPRDGAETRTSPSEAPAESNSPTKRVRRSIDKWETGRASVTSNPQSPSAKEATNPLPRQKPRLVPSLGAAARGVTMTVAAGSQGLERPKGRVAEAKACLIKAKLQINSSRNLKAEIKAEVTLALETLYRLVKEAEAAKPPTSSPAGVSNIKRRMDRDVQDALEGHGLLIQRNLELTEHVMSELKQQGERMAEAALGVGAVRDQVTQLKSSFDNSKVLDGVSYAAVAAAGNHPAARPDAIPEPVHSVVVSSVDAHDTSEDVLNKIRTAVSAKTTGIRVDRLRKAKDQKVVLGCQSRDEMEKVMDRLKADSPTLQIKEVANRDPLVMLFGVLSINTDEDVVSALKLQNGRLLGAIPAEDYRVSVKFRRKARNTLENHVALQVSPQVWRRLTEEGRVHIDLQRVVVKDQSPLVTCSRCLGYGHGRRTCPESEDTCSHCAGSHLRSACPAWQAGETPTCCNCQSARLDRADHNSFDGVCPVRKKWDALARSKVAYC